MTRWMFYLLSRCSNDLPEVPKAGVGWRLAGVPATTVQRHSVGRDGWKSNSTSGRCRPAWHRGRLRSVRRSGRDRERSAVASTVLAKVCTDTSSDVIRTGPLGSAWIPQITADRGVAREEVCLNTANHRRQGRSQGGAGGHAPQSLIDWIFLREKLALLGRRVSKYPPWRVSTRTFFTCPTSFLHYSL